MSTLSRRLAIQTGIVSAFGLATLGQAAAQTSPGAEDALSLMQADPRFSDWVEILKYSGLSQYAQTSKFTAFIPTNNGFLKYQQVLDAVLRSRSRAFPDTTVQVEFVRSHIIMDLHPLSETNGKPTTLTSVAGSPIIVTEPKTGTYEVQWTSINQLTASTHITGSPIIASNAILYPFDDVALG